MLSKKKKNNIIQKILPKILSKILRIIKNQYAISESKLNICKKIFFEKRNEVCFFHKIVFYIKNENECYIFFPIYVYVLREIENESIKSMSKCQVYIAFFFAYIISFIEFHGI